MAKLEGGEFELHFEARPGDVRSLRLPCKQLEEGAWDRELIVKPRGRFAPWSAPDLNRAKRHLGSAFRQCQPLLSQGNRPITNYRRPCGDFVTPQCGPDSAGKSILRAGTSFSDKFYRGRDQRYLVRAPAWVCRSPKPLPRHHGGHHQRHKPARPRSRFFVSRCPLLSGAARSR